MKEQFYPHVGETLYRETLACGLEIAVLRRKGFTKKLCYFVTDFGAIHTDFTMDGKAYTVPAGVAHYLEHKLFDMPDRDVVEEFSSLGAVPNAFTGYDMNAFDAEDTSLLRTAVITVMIFFIVCISNWCFCTLLDGKGRLKDICVVAAYALVPYIIVRILTTCGSWVLAGDEQSFLNYALIVSEIWAFFIAFSGLQEIHEYSFAKTILAIFLTIVGLIIMLFIILMIMMLFQQLYFFLVTIYYEIVYTT